MQMNAIQKLPAYQEAIIDAKDRFNALAGGHVNYGDEEIFAMQLLTKNNYVFDTANKAPNSVQMAMINVASTGLTLNPAMGYAYLVPRDGQIVLDISYKGLIKIATDAGSIRWVRAECVHEQDQFTYHGPAMMPEIKADPFRERGEIIGTYCIAKTVDGDILTEVMDLAAIHVIRGKSSAYTSAKPGKSKGPWEDFFAEMCRKAIIKRARKTWPYTDRDDRMAKAIEIANNAEGGYVFEHEAQPEATQGEQSDEKIAARKAAHDEALARHSESVAFIKERIAADDLEAVASEWRAIPEADQMALWLAWTKGGCFTTEERSTMKTKLPRAQEIAQ
jgi:recombination protein RecT